ncbi:uncharacterized protein LOC113519373 [Galleria mellonella]|uniref:Uncharacterized protein LOC113519373 n=1 Tax=Galleria mellonella TaxID=7137 RepID=A0A6J1WVX6_GALME|nr:uncharacterized protein LOC113519373 [Galleria mellonella]
MRSVLFIAAVVLVFRPCCSRSVDSEESVVSVYTTQPTTVSTTKPFDVYHQIANNIAERITSPIYRFLGINHTKSDNVTTKKPWDKIELLDESTEDVTKSVLSAVDNDISGDRDVEELSVEALKKAEKKPEKIVLYSSYLPAKQILERNDTVNEIDDDGDDELDDFDDTDEKPRQNNFIFILELLGSIVQLVWGGLVAFFKPSNNNAS